MTLNHIGKLKAVMELNKSCVNCRKNWLSWLMIIAPDQVWIFKKQITPYELRGY